MSKTLYIVGALLIAGFVALGVSEMLKAQTPYMLTVAEVKAAGDKPVQFMGAIVPGAAKYDDTANELVFRLKDDKGGLLVVRYKGIKPANFDSAPKAVVRGTYKGDQFLADQVLLKCPSRYRSDSPK